uniref:(northern house mosquito) hypothetical protein n=1 Tax=Culex pipiens TaxID=7175 RepID=A0A8D8FZJ9_CULPI
MDRRQQRLLPTLPTRQASLFPSTSPSRPRPTQPKIRRPTASSPARRRLAGTSNPRTRPHPCRPHPHPNPANHPNGGDQRPERSPRNRQQKLPRLREGPHRDALWPRPAHHEPAHPSAQIRQRLPREHPHQRRNLRQGKGAVPLHQVHGGRRARHAGKAGRDGQMSAHAGTGRAVLCQARVLREG